MGELGISDVVVVGSLMPPEARPCRMQGGM